MGERTCGKLFSQIYAKNKRATTATQQIRFLTLDSPPDWTKATKTGSSLTQQWRKIQGYLGRKNLNQAKLHTSVYFCSLIGAEVGQAWRLFKFWIEKYWQKSYYQQRSSVFVASSSSYHQYQLFFVFEKRPSLHSIAAITIFAITFFLHLFALSETFSGLVWVTKPKVESSSCKIQDGLSYY